MYRKIVSSFVALAVIALVGMLQPAAKASSGGPNGNYLDLCASGYPTGCTAALYPYAGGRILFVLDNASGTIFTDVNAVALWWDDYIWAATSPNETDVPYLYVIDHDGGCANYGIYYETVCSGTSPTACGGASYGCTSPCVAGVPSPCAPVDGSGAQVEGTYTQFNTSEPIYSAYGAVFHELMLSMGLMEFYRASDGGGASAENNPLNADYPNGYDVCTAESWYGAGYCG